MGKALPKRELKLRENDHQDSSREPDLTQRTVAGHRYYLVRVICLNFLGRALQKRELKLRKSDQNSSPEPDLAQRTVADRHYYLVHVIDLNLRRTLERRVTDEV